MKMIMTMIITMIMMIMIMKIIKNEIAITQPIFKLGPQNFA